MIKVVAILATLAFAQAGPTGFGVGAHGAYGGYGAFFREAHVAAHWPHHGRHDLGLGNRLGFNEDHEKMLLLSCLETNASPSTPNIIAVNIKPKTYGYGLAGFGVGNLGLEATIDVYSKDGADVIIAFSEGADALGSGSGACSPEAYGHFIGPDKNNGHGNDLVSPSVATIKLAAGITSSLHIDYLEGFTSLSQLAGRGVIVCKDGGVAQDTNTLHWSCMTTASETVLPCCSLHYSTSHVDIPEIPATPTLTVSPSDATIGQGTGAELTCLTASSGTTTYQFLKGGIQEVSQASDTYSLSPATTNGGDWTCTATISSVVSSASTTTTITVVDGCTDSPCENSGVCDPGADLSSYTCSCGEGWTGTDCDLVQLPNGLGIQYDSVNNGGPWLIFQHRISGDVDFNLNWESYTTGFGNTENYWLGLDFVYSYCNETNPCKLRIDLSIENFESKYAEYKNFYLDGPNEDFTIHLAGYSGDAGDSMIDTVDARFSSNGMKFSTADSDNDKASLNCAEAFQTPWWHKECAQTTLNGVYGSKIYGVVQAPAWFTFNGDWSPLTSTAMKLSQIPQ